MRSGQLAVSMQKEANWYLSIIVFSSSLCNPQHKRLFLSMIKRIGISAIALLYLVTVSGFAVNAHYCFNHLFAVSINVPVKGCSAPGVKMDCCKDTHLVVKVKDAHKGATTSVFAKVFSVCLPAVAFADDYYAAKPANLAAVLYKDLPDPPPGGTPVFLKNRTLRV